MRPVRSGARRTADCWSLPAEADNSKAQVKRRVKPGQRSASGGAGKVCERGHEKSLRRPTRQRANTLPVWFAHGPPRCRSLLLPATLSEYSGRPPSFLLPITPPSFCSAFTSLVRARASPGTIMPIAASLYGLSTSARVHQLVRGSAANPSLCL